MLPLFLIAAVLTGILCLIALASVIVGTVSFFVRRLRPLASWVLFIPSLGALGAASGAWGCGYWGNQTNPYSALPFWAWIGGFLAGGVLGTFLGVLLGWLFRRRMPAAAAPAPATA
jgi:hypothetical protein